MFRLTIPEVPTRYYWHPDTETLQVTPPEQPGLTFLVREPTFWAWQEYIAARATGDMVATAKAALRCGLVAVNDDESAVARFIEAPPVSAHKVVNALTAIIEAMPEGN